MKFFATLLFAVLALPAALAQGAKPTAASVKQLFEAMHSSSMVDSYMKQVETTPPLTGRSPARRAAAAAARVVRTHAQIPHWLAADGGVSCCNPRHAAIEAILRFPATTRDRRHAAGRAVDEGKTADRRRPGVPHLRAALCQQSARCAPPRSV